MAYVKAASLLPEGKHKYLYQFMLKYKHEEALAAQQASDASKGLKGLNREQEARPAFKDLTVKQQQSLTFLNH